MAESITLTGQYALRLIEHDIDVALNSKFKTDNWKYLIYVDTDSVYFEMAPVVNKFFKNDAIPMKVKKLEKIAIDILQDEVNKIVSSACTNMKVYENKLYFKLEAVGDKAAFCLDGDSSVLIGDMQMKISEAYAAKDSLIGNSIISYNTHRQISVQDVLVDVYRRPYSGLMYTFETVCGKRLKVTADHTMFVRRDGTVIEVCAKHVSMTDELVVQ